MSETIAFFVKFKSENDCNSFLTTVWAFHPYTVATVVRSEVDACVVIVKECPVELHESFATLAKEHNGQQYDDQSFSTLSS